MKKCTTLKEKRLRIHPGVFFLLCFFFSILFSNSVSAQNRTVEGIISDAANGEPLIGVSVRIKGMNSGTITDLDGKFTVSASNGTVLVVSYMGYETQEVTIGEQTTIRISLKEDAKILDEVVVVGFGTQKKVNVTGAVGVAKAEDLQSRPVINAAQALQGLVTGLNITQDGGALDKNPSINIRGAGTIGEGSSDDPLILIDGMEGDLNTINPQDIESISVLKDAAASSIYGSRAPFGVILVTTKRGKEGRTVVNYNNNFRWGKPTVKMQMVDSYTFVNYFDQANRNSANSSANFFAAQTAQNILDYRAGLIDGPIPLPASGTQWKDIMTTAYADTDWYDMVYKDRNFSQEHNLSVSGGVERITYYLSLNYLDQDGLLKLGKENLKRYNAAAKIDAKLSEWARLNYSSRFTRNDYSKPSELTGGFYENLGRQTWPNMPMYDNNGNLLSNIVGNLVMGGDYEQVKDILYQQISLELEPVKNLFVIGDFNYRINSHDTHATYLKKYDHDIYGEPVNVASAGNSVTRDYYKSNYLNGNIRARYHTTFNESHNLAVMAGMQVEEFKESKYNLRAYGLIDESLPVPDLTLNMDGTSERFPDVGGSAAEWSSAGFFGRINYDYKERYLVEANLRYDGASRYRQERRWSWFPSFSAGWNIAREEWMSPVEATINTLKLRASYGELGNSATSGNNFYPTYLVLDPNPNSGAWLQDGSKPNTVNTPTPISTYLTWETVRTWNVGLDWGLFNSRLTGSFDYFTRYTLDMMANSPSLPNVYGADLPKVNSADLKTYGWEFEIQWKDRLRNGLDYSVKFLLSDDQTRITRYPNNPTNAISNYIAGELDGNIYGYTTLGIAQSDEEMADHLAQLDRNYKATHGVDPASPGLGQSALGSNWGAGDIMYADINGDGLVNGGSGTLGDSGDKTVIGNKTPRYKFGIDINAAWKGFDIRVFFQGVMKRDYWQGSYYFWGAYNDIYWSTALVQHMDFWRDENSYVVQEGLMQTNTNAYYPRPTFDGSGGHDPGRNRWEQTRYLQNASYIRLKNLQVGYTLPADWTKKAKIENVRIYFSGENLWTGTKLAKMFDPETIGGGNYNGDDPEVRKRNTGNAYPLSTSFSCGISITL